MNKPQKISKNSAEQYEWGDQCLGWHLVKNERLGIIQELMPPKTEEVLHYHNNAQQFFYILQGTALFEIDSEQIKVSAGEGFYIPKGIVHKIKNITDNNIEFIVISEPHAHGDRVIIDEENKY